MTTRKPLTRTAPSTARLLSTMRPPLKPAPPKVPPAFVRLPETRAEVRESTKRADYEGGWQQKIVPSNASIRVYSTSKRWRGIDVYIAKPTFVLGATALLRAKIYAVVEGMDRVLVASGVYRKDDTELVPSRWVCGARCACDRFDVEIEHDDVPPSPGVDMVDVGVIASDELVEIPPTLGAVSIDNVPRIATGIRKAPTPVTGEEGYELVSVHATAIVAARWLHIHDQDSTNGAFLTGIAPVFSFGMAAVGNSVNEVSDLLRTYRFKVGISVCPSSTAATTTPAANDVAYQVFFR